MLSSMISEKLFFSGTISRLSVMILLVGGGSGYRYFLEPNNAEFNDLMRCI